jgi:hypothetical protein
LKVIEHALGFNFGRNEKIWLVNALGTVKENLLFKEPLVKLGESLLRLLGVVFCDRSFPDNAQFNEVASVLEKKLNEEHALMVLATRFKLHK